jgi:hypothetical protein
MSSAYDFDGREVIDDYNPNIDCDDRCRYDENQGELFETPPNPDYDALAEPTGHGAEYDRGYSAGFAAGLQAGEEAFRSAINKVFGRLE